MNRRRLADSASPGSKLNSIDESVALTDFSSDGYEPITRAVIIPPVWLRALGFGKMDAGQNRTCL